MAASFGVHKVILVRMRLLTLEYPLVVPQQFQETLWESWDSKLNKIYKTNARVKEDNDKTVGKLRKRIHAERMENEKKKTTQEEKVKLMRKGN